MFKCESFESSWLILSYLEKFNHLNYVKLLDYLIQMRQICTAAYTAHTTHQTTQLNLDCANHANQHNSCYVKVDPKGEAKLVTERDTTCNTCNSCNSSSGTTHAPNRQTYKSPQISFFLYYSLQKINHIYFLTGYHRCPRRYHKTTA